MYKNVEITLLTNSRKKCIILLNKEMRATEWLPRSYKNKSFTLVEQNDLFFYCLCSKYAMMMNKAIFMIAVRAKE